MSELTKEDNTRIKELEIENDKLRELLSKKYSIKKMRSISMSVLLPCIFALFISLFTDETVIHPILAVIGIMMSVSFLGMAQWRANNAEG